MEVWRVRASTSPFVFAGPAVTPVATARIFPVGLSEIQMRRGESGTDNGLSSDQQKVGKRYVDVTPPL
eukprot:symbB.v1.2.039082.t1/scaffold6338.1/size21769/2